MLADQPASPAKASEYIVRVRVVPGARREKITTEKDGTYTIYVREPAQHNLANTRVRAVLAAVLGVPIQRIHMRTGARSPIKRFVIRA